MNRQSLARDFVCMTLLLYMACFVATDAAGQGVDTCRIEVVEKGLEWPVPLVELRTVSGLRFVTDNAGLIAVDAPELFDREVWFHVSGHGYEVAKDGFGYRGVRLIPQRGKTLRVEVNRTNIAKRMGRLTGSGLLAESLKLDATIQDAESGVVGCDSVQTAVHRGRSYWVWGDSNVARYPLGVFQATGATSAIQPLKSLIPPTQLPYELWRDDKARPRAVSAIPGRGPTWLSGMVSLPDAKGDPHLVTSFVKVEPPLDVWQRGLAVWDESAAMFTRHTVLWSKGDEQKGLFPDGHACFWTDEENQRWLLFGNPLPTLRMPATFEAWCDPATWEPLTPAKEMPAVGDQATVKPHSGSLAWNAFRKRWIALFVESFGQPSPLGEVWYAEAKSPLGPFGPAIKVLSHDNYSFYNPRLHAEFTDAGSPILFFEGTYTVLFTGPGKREGNALMREYPTPTPRYDYNQILYRLDLDDSSLREAQP